MNTPAPDRRPMPQPPYPPNLRQGTYQQVPPPYPTSAYPPPNMWPPQPPAGLSPQHPGARPQPYPTPQPMPVPAAKVRNTPAIVAVTVAVVGLVFSTVPILRAVFGIAAVVLCLVGQRRVRARGANLQWLAAVGGLLGFLEVTAWLFG